MNRRKREILQKYDIEPEQYDELYRWAPRRRTAFVEWMVRQVSQGNSMQDVIAAVGEFHGKHSQLTGKDRDLYSYKTLVQLQKKLVKIDPLSKRKRKRKDPGYKKVKAYRNVVFYQLTSYEGSKTMSKDTRWCISKESDYRNYANHLILVAVVQDRKARDRFSKFAIVVERGVRPWTDGSLVTWKRLKEFRSRRNPGEAVGYTIYDELDEHEYDEHNKSAREEVLDLMIGRPGALRTLVKNMVDIQDRYPDRFLEVMKILREGKRTPIKDFNKAADLVHHHHFFDVISLFTHPRARTKACRDHLWKLAQDRKEKLSTKELDFMVQTPAASIPRVVELYLRTVRPGWNGDWPVKRLSAILENRTMSIESKKLITDFVGQELFKMKGSWA